MPSYAKVAVIVGGMGAAAAEEVFLEVVVPHLVDLWIDDYGSHSSTDSVRETRVGDISYLYDAEAGRLVAAWGLTRGRHEGKRDTSRLAGHALGAGSAHHRGHSIPHSLGGQADINLVAELTAVNIGPFRPLERRADAAPGSLYFTYWKFGPRDSKQPVGVEQGVLRAGELPRISSYPG